MTINSLADILPLQDHYYLLLNGSRYVCVSTEEANGLLIFENLERVEQFRMTSGGGLPEFNAIKVPTDEVLEVLFDVGAVCVTQEDGVIVASLNKVGDVAEDRDEMVLKDGGSERKEGGKGKPQ